MTLYNRSAVETARRTLTHNKEVGNTKTIYASFEIVKTIFLLLVCEY